MSQVDIYADIIMRTAAGKAAVDDFATHTRTVMGDLGKITAELQVTFAPPDRSALQQMVRQVEQEGVNIPVRFVTDGASPTATPSAGSTFGSNTASNSGPSAPVSAGATVAAADAVGRAAAQAINTSDLAQSLATFRRHIDDTGTELFGLQHWLARITAVTPPTGGGGGGGQQAPQGRAARRRANRANSSPPASTAGPFAMSTQRPSGNSGAARRGPSRRTLQGVQGFANGLGQNFNGAGYNGRGGGRGRRGSAGGRRHAGGPNLGSFIRSHPSLSRLFGGLGLAYTASNIARSAVDIGEAGYIPTGNVASWAIRQQMQRDQAVRQGIENVVPVFGSMATNAADFLTGIGNWSIGKGFVSMAKRREYEAGRADLRSETDFETRRSDLDFGNLRTYDPRQRALNEYTRRGTDLEQRLTDTRYRDRENPAELNDEGKRIKAAGERNNQAQYDRERSEASAAVTRRNADAWVDQRTANRNAGESYMRSQDAFDRNAQLETKLAAIDERIEKRRNAVKEIQDPAARADAERVLGAEELAAVQEKAATAHEERKKWALEDAETVAQTEAANLQATGKYFEATEKLAQQAAEARIRLEQDAGRRVILAREAESQRLARLAVRNEQTRQFGLAADESQATLENRGVDFAKKKLNEEAMQQDLGLTAVDAKTGERGWRDRSSMTPEEQKRLDALIRDRDNKAGIMEREQRLQNDATRGAAGDINSRLGGNAYKAELDKIERDRKASLERSESDDQRKAANELADAQRAEAARRHDDQVKEVRLSGRQAKMRSEGRERDADFEGTKNDIAIALRDVADDPTLRKATIESSISKLEEQQRKGMTSQMFGSMSEYASASLMSTMNDPSTVLTQVSDIIRQLKEAMTGTAEEQKKAALAIQERLRGN